MLAVAHTCRECGARLDRLEALVHHCAAALEWPYGGDAVAGPWAGAARAAISSGACRIVRLSAQLLASRSASSRFGELWDYVRSDLSHGLDPPAPSAAAAGECAMLLALRGREVVGLLWAERATSAALLEADEADSHGGATETAPQVPVQLGVALVWVRRSERRRGLATAMLDAARSCMAPFGAAVVSKAAVAFSQPTSMGAALACGYSGAYHAKRVPVYCPSWA